MARKVTAEANGPYAINEEELEEQGGGIYICQCGLSDNKPNTPPSGSVGCSASAATRSSVAAWAG